jgi:hypothetical protein
MFEELKFCLHIHTHYSDGNANHQQLIDIAQKAGLNGIITTDHNIWLDGVEGYFGEGKNKFMLLVGEEVHDRHLKPPGNHLLAIGAMKELAPFSHNPQRLIDQINQGEGLSFLAHPIEDPLEMFNEKDFSWRNWEVKNFTGLEIWNQLSEFKSVSKNFLSAATNALFPKRMSQGPLNRTLALWDDLIEKQNRPIVGVGGVDAHMLIKHFGPVTIKLYPYLHHFKSVTTHLLIPKPLMGNFQEDKKSVINAFRSGHCFIAYDLPAPTDGFRFSVHNDDGNFIMGDQVKVKGGLTFQIRLPQRALCRLFRNGKMIQEWPDREVCTHITTEPGVYRVEAFLPYKGKLRGWIFSNPIYAWL